MGVSAEKTWGKYWSGPLATGAVDSTNQLLMFHIKEGLRSTYDGSGFGGAGAWSVVGSSDGVNASMDGTDRWTDETKLVWSPTNHSWIVMKQTGIATNYQLCIDLHWGPTYTEYAEMVVSKSAGFTGGTISARPTATDELVLQSGNAWGVLSTYAIYTLNACKTSDGACNRFYISRNGAPSSMWIFDLPKNPVSWWPTPYICKINLIPTLANMHNSSINSVVAEMDSQYYPCVVTAEGIDTGALTEITAFQAPDIGGNWICSELGVCLDSASKQGRLGDFFDWWFIPSSLPDGEYMRGSGSPYDYVVFGDVLQPFDGTVWHN